jgi:hypothetical protein
MPLHAGREREHVALRAARSRDDFDDLRLAERQRAGPVEDHDVEPSPPRAPTRS